MKVHSEQLISGCIIKEPIYSLTSKPIVPRKTILNETHIEFIKAFMIKEIEVEELLSNGELFNPKPIQKKPDENNSIKDIFISDYLNTVHKYKEMFNSWANGSKVNVNELRNIFYPLLEKAFECPDEVFFLSNYSKKEDYIYHHSVSIALMAAILASKLNNNLMDCFQISFSALLCDIGLTKVPANILNKTEKLTKEDYDEIKKHATYSFRILSNIEGISDDIKMVALQHNERLDGSGYPLSISGSKLHYYTKIIGVADEFHSLVCDQYNQNKISPYKAIEVLTNEYFGKFDLAIINALINCICNLVPGDFVKLSNGKIGEIVFIDPNHKTRPMIKVEEDEIICLTKSLNVYIDEVL
ncbi:MAG: phosphohydrolase [Bacillales bacterium]|nr:phosphohydrolase [Bacillales bacterium]